MSTVWGIKWPSQDALLVALKLADYANDDGSSVYPARDTLADCAHCSLSTVQRVLAGFKACALLLVVKPGGNGRGSTTEYRLNVATLEALHAGGVVFAGAMAGKNDAGCFNITAAGPVEGGENKGVTVNPLYPQAVHGEALAVHGDPVSGSHGEPQPIILDPPLKTPLKKTEIDERKVVGGAKPAIEIFPTDLCWRPWIEALCVRGKEGLAADAEQAGAMTVQARWPKPDTPLPRVDRRKFQAGTVAARIQGGN